MESITSLQQMLADRQGSPVADLLSEPPRLVEIPPPPTVSIVQKGVELANRVREALGVKSQSVEAEAEPVKEKLSREEIKLLAQSKADTTAALLTMLFTVLNKLIAYQELRKGDQKAMDKYKEEVALTGFVPPEYLNPNHPIHDVKNRWENFEDEMRAGEELAQISEPQKQMLLSAYEAELTRKNNQGKLEGGTVQGAIFQIFAVKLATPLAAFGTMMVNKQMRRVMN